MKITKKTKFISPIDRAEAIENNEMRRFEKEKEYCEHCKKLITDKMKNDQHVIYASAEHTLSAPQEGQIIVFNDPMFGGVYCCRDCYEEEAGIKLARETGKEEAQAEFKENMLMTKTNHQLGCMLECYQSVIENRLGFEKEAKQLLEIASKLK